MEVRFAEEYALKTDDELVRLWADRESLMPEAREALSSELRVRQLDADAESASFDDGPRGAESRDRWPEWQRVPQGWQPVGYGRIGRLNYTFDRATLLEEFDTVVFAFFLFFPVVARIAFRIQRPRRDTKQWRILSEVPIPLRTVRLVRAKALILAALAIALLIKGLGIWLS